MTQHNDNLSLNHHGKDVATLQGRLLTLGYTIATSEIVNELFGESTWQAVQHFQRDAGLPVTGTVDASTARVLVSRFEADRTMFFSPRPGMPPSVPGSQQRALSSSEGTPPSSAPRIPPSSRTPPIPPQPPVSPAPPQEPPPNDPGKGSDGTGKRVYGEVRNAQGALLEHVMVLAFAREMRTEELVGRSPTRDGRYDIRYQQKDAEETTNLVLKVLDANGTLLYTTPIHYAVPDEIEINLGLQDTSYQGPSEFEVLTTVCASVIDDIAPADLQENDQFQDISFIAGETGRSRLLVGTWAAAYRLANRTAADKTPLEPAAIYAFMRQGQPALLYDTLLQDMKDAGRIILLEEKVLRDLANLSPDHQQLLLEQALTDNLVPMRLREQVPAILATLQQIKLRFSVDIIFGGGKGTIGQLLDLNPAARQGQAAFLTAFVNHTGPMKDFWANLEKDKVLPPLVVQQVRITFELGALTSNHIPLVGALTAMFQRGELREKRDLARYTTADWIRLFQRPGADGKPIGVPENTDGATEEAKYEQFAVKLERSFARTYPTTAFSANLARSEKTPVVRKTDTVHFLDTHPAFHLDRHRIDQYLAGNQDALKGVADPQGLLVEIKAVQRVFKLNRSYQAVDALLSRKIDSAQQIYFLGKGQFLTLLQQSGLTRAEIKRMYYRAENAYAQALNLFGAFNTAVNGIVPLGIPSPSPDPSIQAKIGTLPNLQTLFGSLDYCECTECRSVYSPAAYFVDIMHFLGDRTTNGTGPNAGKNVSQVLLERRPDLGEIELSCENTNTPLPYIDLVNEILEDVVAPPLPVTLSSAIQADLVPGPVKQTVLSEFATRNIPLATDAIVYAPDIRNQWAIRDQQHAYKLFIHGAALQLLPTKQTFLSAAELLAHPEYTNQAAYDMLALEVFPFNLPLNLWYLQTRTYLTHLGVPQPRLCELFQQRLLDNVTLVPGDLQIDCAWLGISESLRKILTGTFPAKAPWDFWGLTETGNTIPDPENPADPTKNLVGHWIDDILSHVNVMLQRSGLTYKELLQLLDMQYINPTGSVFIFDTADPNAASCDTSLFTIRNLTTDILNRIQRFIRLWRVLGCQMWELDLLLPDTNPDPKSVDKQITDAALEDISRMSRLRAQYDLDWRSMYSLYHDLDHTIYLDYSADGTPAIQTLYQRLFHNKLVDAVAPFPASPDQLSGPISAQVPGILAALRIKEADLNLILKDLTLTPAESLDWTRLSHIYRIATLARAPGLSVEMFLSLKNLWAQDPFANSAATQAFARLVDKVAAADISIPELDYLLAHHFTPNSGVALEDKTISACLQMLREGLQKISDDLSLKNAETSAAYVKSKLGLLPALVKDADQVNALAIIADTWQGTPAERNTLIDTYFVHVLDLTVAKTQLAAIPSGLSPADHQGEVDKRFAYVQPALEACLLQAQKENVIEQKVAEVLSLEVPSATDLLTGLHLPGSANTLLQSLNDARVLSKLPDDTYQFALTEGNFPDIFNALRLLYKDALMISKLRMRTDELAWWLAGTHAADMGWMHPNDFPLDTTTSVPLVQWEHIQDVFSWKSTLPTSNLTVFEFLDSVLDAGITGAETITQLAQLTGWDEADISALVTAFNWDVKQAFKDAANLLRLADCMRALHRLGVNAARTIPWAKAEPTSDDAESLKQTVKARYDLDQWLQVIQPLQDEFREQKRQALVSWLVTHPNQAQGQSWSESNGLYSYFLIDVEMSSCMLTSRIKQASASVQLFVQRCLLNLEVDILAKTDFDSKWKQWAWMKRYRVWEANRKIFLYPENWIEPELRDEKSPFFKDLENELMQNDITSDTVEQAYLNYLEKLDTVANLEIRALFNEPLGQDQSVLHVFARSRSSQTPHYYYRRRINGARWLAWEKVDLEITANHLIAGVHNRRLYLLWPQWIEKADQTSATNIPVANTPGFQIPQPTRYWEIRLFWSELKQGKWTPKVLTDAFGTVYQSATGGDAPQRIDFRTRLQPFIGVRLFDSTDPATTAPTGTTQFNKIGQQIEYSNAATIEHLISPPASQFANNLIEHTSNAHFFYFASIEETGKGHTVNAHQNAQSIQLLQQIAANSTYSVIDAQAQGFANAGSFFVWDTNRSYFVDYIWQLNYSYYGGAWHPYQVSAFRFFIHYHPFVELFIKELNIWGIKGLLNRQIQIDPASIPASPPLFNFTDYKPTSNVVKSYMQADGSLTYPLEDVDFTYLGAYSPYNWELFFHVPFLIANRLSTNQRFEEALEWYHYIFDPTSTDTAVLNPDTPQQKYWITKPFYATTRADYYKQKIENLLLAIAQGDAEARAQVEEWRANPFNPHLIARMRTVAYQKNVLIKYIQTLIAWGDQLFSGDTIETINEATQLYMLAASILGPRPKSVPKKVANPIKTFYQLEQEGIDDFGNSLKQIENLLPSPSSSSSMGDDQPELPRLNVLYFCIPNNEKLLTLWDTVADRLFKIRHCMNIAGVVRQLPLFEPPIDPGLLVKAAAAGLDIGAILNESNAPLPVYRFTFMLEKAMDLCNEVKALGAALLAALEKKDAEALARLRSSNALIMLDAVRQVKIAQIDETQAVLDALKESRHVVEERQAYFEKLKNDGLNGWEILSLVLTGGAIISEIVSTVLSGIAAGTSLIPQFTAGAAGFGGSPVFVVTTGGGNVSSGLSNAANVLRGVTTILQMGSGMSSTIGSYNRRADEWDHQKRLAEKELPQIDHQITAADIRHTIANRDLSNHDRQTENTQKEDDYMHSKFTNQELYDWMIHQISTVYFQSYQLAYEIAKRTERCFRYELGLSDSNYVRFGYWDSLQKGLLSGERLSYDLRRMEMAFYEQNRRAYELTKHVSLGQIDPVALLKLRQNGECFVDIPETVFDMDYPGHYFRRITSVSLSIPCVAGPYTAVACTLTLTSNHLRTDATLLSGKYERDLLNADPRFRDEIAAIQSIATSSAQRDNGMFELNFRDERYLPFEGAGALSSWHIQLNQALPQFDFSTISDVIIHLNYTAREGGDLLKSKAVEALNTRLSNMALAESRHGLFRIFDIKREYPDKWYTFLHPANPADDQQVILENLQDRLPYFTRQFPTKKARRIDVVAQMKDGQTYKVMLSPLGNTEPDFLSLTPTAVYQGLDQASKDLTGSEVALGTWTLKLKLDGAVDFKSLPADAVEELFLIVNYILS